MKLPSIRLGKAISLLLCLGGKCLRNRNSRPEEGDLLLSEEPPVDVRIHATYSKLSNDKDKFVVILAAILLEYSIPQKFTDNNYKCSVLQLQH